MSFFAIITFDLSYPKMSPHGTNVYKMITGELEDLDFYKVKHGKKSTTPFELPANTYVADFDEDDCGGASELADEISKDLKVILKRLQVKGRFFVSVGTKWAWKGGEI